MKSENIDKLMDFIDEEIKDCEELEKQGHLSREGRGAWLMAKGVREFLDRWF